MSRIAKSRPRAYTSDLRQRQAEETRSRILEATLRVMARGVASVSIPAVASEAGVSVPTIYRHFGTKADLLGSLYAYAEQRTGLPELVVPTTVDELRTGVLAVLERLDRFDDVARAALASPSAEETRRLSIPKRVAFGRRVAQSLGSELSPADRERVARLLVVLTTSASLRVWREHLGVSAEQAADDIEWVVRACATAASKEPTS